MVIAESQSHSNPFGVTSPEVISIVLEYIPSVNQLLKLRLASKAFDTALFRTILSKVDQARATQAQVTREVNLFNPDDKLRTLKEERDELMDQCEELLEGLNTLAATSEFYAWEDTAPEYLQYMGEALGEFAGLIPLRVFSEER